PERRPSVRALVAAGALMACGLLSKQSGVPLVIPFFVWVIAATFARPAPTRLGQAMPLVAFSAGFVAPFALVAVVYLASGNLRTFLFWYYVYNTSYYMRPFSRAMRNEELRRWLHGHLLEFALGIAMAAWAISRPLFARAHGIARAIDERGFEVVVGLGAVG